MYIILKCISCRGDGKLMVTVYDKVGTYAGKIWETLYKEGPLTEAKLMSKTRLKDTDFYCGIGWLARENKVIRDHVTYKLGETNMVNKVGRDAGKIWRVLDTWGEVDLTSITRLARIKEKDVYSAVGWLAREGKVNGNWTQQNVKKIKFWLH